MCVSTTPVGKNDQKVGNLGVGKSPLHVLDNLVNNTVFHLDSLLLEAHEPNIACDKEVTLLYRNKIYQNLYFRIHFVSLS